MDKNFANLSPEQMRALVTSPAARELMKMLRDNRDVAMDEAILGAKNGDQAAVQRSLAAILSDPRAKELLRQIQEGQHGRNGR